MKQDKFEKNIESILQVTKNVIKLNDNFHEYYVSRNNDLYKKQLSLLKKKFKLIENNQAKKNDKSPIIVRKKLSSLDAYSTQKFNNIRQLQIRSSKLPPLCPFYDDKGKLIPSVILTSKINIKKLLYQGNNNINNSMSMTKNSSMDKLNSYFGKSLKLIKSIKKTNLASADCSNNSVDSNLNDNFEKDIFIDPEYSVLTYNENEIFGKKEEYMEIIKKKINELKNKPNENLTEKKEKIFEWKKKSIFLELESMNISFYEVTSDKKNIINTYNTKNFYENNNNNSFNNIENETPYFSFYLPFALLPLFYCKGDETFKIILSQLLIWDEKTENFSVNPKLDQIISKILINCEDFDINIHKRDELESLSFHRAPTLKKKKRAGRTKKSPTNRLKKSQTNKFFRQNSSAILESRSNSPHSTNINFNKNTNYDINSEDSNNNNNNNLNNANNVSFSNYLENVQNKVKTFNIYPKISVYNYFNQNIFEFIWLTPTKIFKVIINTPLITVNIPNNNIYLKQYVNFDLLFYMYKLNFLFWDFYCINYLSSFKIFRNLITQLNSFSQTTNHNLYLTRPHIKKYLFSDNKCTNIITKKLEKKFNREVIESPIFFNVNKIQEENENDLISSILIQKSEISIVNFIDNNKKVTNQFIIHLNFNQIKKFEIMEKYVDKISFLIKFLDINYEKGTVNFNYNALNSFDEQKWIKDLEKYNFSYLYFLEQKMKLKLKEVEKNDGEENIDNPKIKNNVVEYEGLKKNTFISIEMKCPIAVNRWVKNDGTVEKDMYEITKQALDKISNIKDKNMFDLSKIYYDETNNAKMVFNDIVSEKKGMKKSFRKNPKLTIIEFKRTPSKIVF